MIDTKEKYIYLSYIVIIFFLSDLITNISINYFEGSLSRLSGVVKLFFEIVMFGYIIKNFKEIHKHTLLLLLVLFFSFAISNSANVFSKTNYWENFFSNAYYFNRYSYIFLFIIFLQIYNPTYQFYHKIVRVFKGVMFINCIMIVIGWLFEIELFRSYPNTVRFGYDGLFSKDGEAVYYYIFFISILYYEYWLNNNNINLTKIGGGTLITLLMGKKAILLFLFLLLIGHMVFVVKKGKELACFLTLIIILIVSFKSEIVKLFIELFSFWNDVYEAYGFWGAVTSTRSGLFIDFIDFMNSEWRILNYLFGWGEYEKYMVEFEIVDIFLFFGIAGIIVYCFLIKNYFFSKQSKTSNVVILSTLLTSFFSGALFLSVSCMMMFYIITKWVDFKENNNKPNKRTVASSMNTR